MAPKTKDQFEEIRQRSIATIKEAALELFAHNGFHSTSISQIAKEAKVSKGLLYNYFKSKDALLEAIIVEAMDNGEHMMDELRKQVEEPFQLLELITVGTFQMIENNLHYWKLMTSLAFQTDVMEHLTASIHARKDKAIAEFIELFSEIGIQDAKREAFAYGALLDGILIQYMQLDDNYPLEEMKDFVMNRYLKDLKKRITT